MAGPIVVDDPLSPWIFAYGSLIWNPGFRFIDKRVGYISGWQRRFYQGSDDHRGTPDQPGRVVTLVTDAAAYCWGVAYRVADDDLQAVLDYLDHREKCGFERLLQPFVCESGQALELPALVYYAPPNNPDYLGPTSDTHMARHIHTSVGPSGTNRDYLFKLSDSLRAINVEDRHVFDLEAAVRKLAFFSAG